MRSQRRSASRSQLVLLVGGDLTTARSCARAACPLPVIRARHVSAAVDHVRSMRPVAILVASDVTQEDAAELTRVADGRVRVLHLDETDDLDADLRSAVAHR